MSFRHVFGVHAGPHLAPLSAELSTRRLAMFQKLKRLMFSIRVTVMFLFITLSLLIIIVALSLQSFFSQHLAKESANILFSSAAQRVSEKIYSLDVESSDLALLLSQYPGISGEDEGGCYGQSPM
ncbi:hypothetical protein P4S72_23960 [Vibrio sp. PP-XX7]